MPKSSQYNRSELGKAGEAAATGYLEKLGYRVLGRNYRKPYGEIDIIAQAPDRTLVFVEVKTMICRSDGITPENQLTPFKLRKMQRMAQLFANWHPKFIDEERGWRIDLLAIQVRPTEKRAIIKHYKNI